MKRYEYALRLARLGAIRPPPGLAGLEVRTPTAGDADALARLMLDAYRGTIDYDDETLEDAAYEIEGYLVGERGAALLGVSRLAVDRQELAGACLVSMWDARALPIIAHAMTGAAWKGRGIAERLLWEALQALAAVGYEEVRAVITAGNTPSERAFARMGFTRWDAADA